MTTALVSASEPTVAGTGTAGSPAVPGASTASTPRDAARAVIGAVRSASTRVGRVARSFPVTLTVMTVFAVAELIAAALPGPLLDALSWAGTGVGPLADGHWWTPVTSLFFADSPLQFIFALAATGVLVGAAERLMGGARTALAFAATGVTGILAGIGLQWLGLVAGVPWVQSTEHLMAVTPFTGALGALAAASAFAGVLWRRRIRLMSLLVVGVFVLYAGQPTDLYRVLAVLAGTAMGELLVRLTDQERPIASWTRSSNREVRVLLASVVAAVGAGPVVALLSHGRFGLLAPFAELFATPATTPACATGVVSTHCLSAFSMSPIAGGAAVVFSLLPLGVLLVTAYGLVFGSRFALVIATVVNVVLAFCAAISFGLVSSLLDSGMGPLTGARGLHVATGLVIAAIVPLCVAVALVLARRRFTVMPSRRSVQRFAVIVTVTGAALAGLCLAVSWLGDAAVLAAATPFQVTVDIVSRFLPLRAAVALHTAGEPFAVWLVLHAVGPLFWAVVLVAALPPMLTMTAGSRAGDARAAQRLVRRGGDALAYMTTWTGNRYWFDDADIDAAADAHPDADDRTPRTAVAYRVINGIAITTGGPLGTPTCHEATLRRFARFCDDHGWVPVFYSIDGDLSQAVQSMGWRSMVVAEEAVILPQLWSTAGKKWQDVRSSANRAQRAGIRAVWTRHSELSPAQQTQLMEISDEWISGKDLPEMGFTLGGLDELRDPEVRLMLAVDEGGRIEAVTSWMPRYRDDMVVGWTLDFMRRRTDSINGIMEFVIAASAEQMRDDGAIEMSLSGAPLAHAGAGESRGALDGILARLSTTLEPMYGFRSLLRFKRKFQPEFRPMLMAYPDSAALPRIGVAIARAYAPELSWADAARFARGARG
ncbi:DUF2156 domain-containing protein [Humibacter ginsenosidimutans]|nr:DUF2156 domain-containing protein [Humibacter ginsenosidimutans]